MFQDFQSRANPADGPPRLAALRKALTEAGLAGWIVPRTDAYQGEYVAPCDERLAWLMGFTGSAGTGYVTQSGAALATDGRYRLQGRAQCADEIDLIIEPEARAGDWLRAALPQGGQVGFDPWLHTPGQLEALRKALGDGGITLVPHANLIDRIWPDRPAPPAAPARAHPPEWAGETSADKRARLAEALRHDGQRAAVLSLPDSICWLLNLRGGDIRCNPLMQGFAILHDDARVTLFTQPEKLAGIAPEGVTIRPTGDLLPALGDLPGPVRIDPATAPVALFDRLRAAGTAITEAPDPCLLPKARKNSAELAGMRAAHLRDGAAMVRFLSWLDRAMAAGEPLDEITLVTRLEGFRAETGALRDLSFDTICGTGPHGAIIHYRVTEPSNRALRPGDVLLIDSGGQYADGTTDITRTLPVGDPANPALDPARVPFTRVLQGMIALSRLRFPRGLAGRDLDPVARAPLWSEGLDYDHGTGHGVGAALSVHEGPARISRAGALALEPGMILSNEPGYYRPDAFGIRLENLIAVQEAEAETGRDFLGFETLTLCPIDRGLIRRDLLSPGDIDWLDRYHADVRAALMPLIPASDQDWLTWQTRPL